MTGDISIYGGIGTERNEISFDNVKSQLEAVKDSKELALHIVSPGGDVFEGEAIYNLLKNSGKKITTYVEGTCASIATLIAAAGDQVIMNTTSRWMVHNPKISGLSTSADARDLRHVANQLDKIKTLLIDVWDKRTTIGKEKLWELYDNETWLTAAEAKQMGFADQVEDAIRAVAKVDLKKLQMTNKKEGFMNVIRNLFQLSKIKNEYTETLADGRVIIVLSDTEDWTGKQVILEDGSSLEPGDYEMADGKVLTIGDGGIISTVTDPEPAAETKEEQPTENDMKEIESLKAQLAEALAAKEAAEALSQQAQAETATAKQSEVKIENRLKVIEQVLEKAGETVGDKTPPKVATGLKMINKQQPIDHMGEMALDFYKKRNIIKPSED